MKQFTVNLLVEMVVTGYDESNAMEEARDLIHSFENYTPIESLNGVVLPKTSINASTLCVTEVGQEHPWHRVFCLIGDSYYGAIDREVSVRRAEGEEEE